jgi:hypothetical protein
MDTLHNYWPITSISSDRFICKLTFNFFFFLSLQEVHTLQAKLSSGVVWQSRIFRFVLGEIGPVGLRKSYSL